MIGQNRVIVIPEQKYKEHSQDKYYENNFETSEKLLDYILENSRDIIAIVNKTGHFVYLSPSIEQVSGFQLEELIGMSIFEFAHPDDADRLVTAYKEAYRTRTHKRIAFRNKHKDGHYVWFEHMGKLLCNEHGQVQGGILFGRDITDRKMSEDALRESETQLRSIFNNASVGIILVNKDGYIKTVNKAFCSFLGYNEEKVIGLRISEFIEDEDQDSDIHLREELFNTNKKSYVIEKRFRRNNGEIVWARLNVSLIEESRVNYPCLVVVCEDITSLKVKESELGALKSIYTAMHRALEEASVTTAQSNDEMRSLADLAMSLQLVGYEELVAGRVLEVICELTGASGVFYGYDEHTRSLKLIRKIGLSEKGPASTRKIDCFMLGEEKTLVGKVAETRESLYIPDVLADSRWIMIDSDVEIHSSYLIPVFYGEKLFGVLSLVSQDIDGFPPKRQAFADSIAYFISAAMENARLFAETQHAYECINVIQQQLLQSQKMDAIGQLAGGMAHDINNHMTTIQACVDLYGPRVDQEELREGLIKIRRAAEKSANLTRQLMLFGSKQPQFKKPIDLNHNLWELREMIESLIVEDINLQLYLAPDLWAINADSSSMNQLVINLVLNARDAMPEGGHLMIRTRNVVFDNVDFPLELGCKYQSKYICFSVTDSGTGIDEDVRMHLFEPFISTKEPGEGTGMGLPVVYGITRSHQGCINVKSQPGQGSTFEIFLPAL